MPRFFQNVIALAAHVLYFTRSSTTLQECMGLGEHESSLTKPEPEFTCPKIMRDSI